MTETKHYVVAMIREAKRGSAYDLKPLNTGVWYDRETALKKAADLNNTCHLELKHLAYDRFVAYNILTV